ncbi:MAG: GNAT family N-acetyltransferase [Acidobacteria bacterium]|nr:GNAT family N-acetyltransferase [Acidobacteriota bacterium]
MSERAPTRGDDPPQPELGEPVDDRPARRPERVTLHGRDVTLVPLDPAAHADALFESTSGPDHDPVWTYLLNGPFHDRASFRQFISAMADSDDPLFFAITRTDDGLARGLAAYMRIEPQHRVVEVGSIVYGPALQRTRGATEAMYLMARHVFEVLGYRRYEWKCNALNAPSRRAALRLGFTFEGIFRQHMIVKGRNRDTAWFSMLDSEWPSKRARFEEWLAPGNFDAAGRQKRSLAPRGRPNEENNRAL